MKRFKFSVNSFLGVNSYLICWLASLRILSTSFPFSSSSFVRVLMFSLSVWIWWSSWAMWFFLLDTSSCSSEMRPNSSRSCQGGKTNSVLVVQMLVKLSCCDTRNLLNHFLMVKFPHHRIFTCIWSFYNSLIKRLFIINFGETTLVTIQFAKSELKWLCFIN